MYQIASASSMTENVDDQLDGKRSRPMLRSVSRDSSFADIISELWMVQFATARQHLVVPPARCRDSQK